MGDSFDEDDFIRQFTRSQAVLRRFIVGLTPTSSDADDVLQEVNLALWKKRHLYIQDSDFLRWAFAFAALEARSFRSRSARGRLWFSDATLDTLAEAWPGDSPFDEQRREALSQCLAKLSQARQIEHQFITAYYSKQATAKDLARTSGKPLSTVYKILTRGREALRQCVKRAVSVAC